ncbi:MAG: DUF2284 domain-containing protein [Synergistes sp.]|nr:DUF2284 domain-containing protein [Synergistes sp.]
MSNYSLKRYSAVCSCDDFVKSCVNVEKFLKLCKECRNYGNNWMCPPFDFDPMDVWKRYDTVRLEAVQIVPAQTTKRLCCDVTVYAYDILTEVKKKLRAELLEEEKKIKGSMSFYAGSCDVCAECARIRGEKCRFPETARHSIESIGADVSIAVKKYLGLDILWIKDCKLPEYLTLAAALLVPKQESI